MAEPIDPTLIPMLLNEVTKEQKELIEAKVAQCIATLEMYYKRKFVIPVIEYDLKGSTAGRANSQRIKINVGLLHTEWDDMLAHTIPHEVAHVVQGQLFPHSKPHGWEWQGIMRRLGLPPDRCHSYDTKPARVHARPYIYTCNCPGREFAETKLSHSKMQAGKRYRCKICRTELRFKEER